MAEVSECEQRFTDLMGMTQQEAQTVFNRLNGHGLFVVSKDYIAEVNDLRLQYSLLLDAHTLQETEILRQRERANSLCQELHASRQIVRQWELRLARIKEVTEET